MAAKSTFIRGGDFHVSLNDDDKRHSQCVGAMNPSFIAWSWSVHAHRVAPHSLCGDDRFTQLRGGVRTRTHIHTHTYIQTYIHTHMVSRDDDFLTPSVAAKSTFIRGGDFHVH